MKHKRKSIEQATNKEILRKQLEMLAKDSFTNQDPITLTDNSKAMVAIYKALNSKAMISKSEVSIANSLTVTLGIMALYLIINLFVIIMKGTR